ncbi:MAG TPA: adenylate/guanylate cyclase domain-containing protein [Gaiellaceae bacterium]
MTPCPHCGTENAHAAKFCTECGTSLLVPCASCGAANAQTAKFCAECGTALADAQAAESPRSDLPARVAERRLVSVLFADLVGFTTLSESRDAEEVRELLSRYFETCNSLIARYGGTVEKFIGDAVMAVWGAPVATEDDAERAVRAALDLVDAVAALGNEIGAPSLRARAGVLTGEAAVTLGAEGQGMVAGDLVNSASRIQAVAEPGTVLVGEATKRASEQAIVYEDAGTRELKGKAEPVPLWQAIRVVALRRGMVRSAGLEPPFVGRQRELRLVKELFHAAAQDRKTHLVSVLGVGGIGKSRLAWEFEKYIDGLATEAWWHWGRCLAYGEGVAFWALAEMLRGRAGISEDEPSEDALPKLRAAVQEYVPDADEQRFVEPRLAHLLGLEERSAGDQENVFAAARLFFERLSELGPTVLVFEDIHWADSALLDFIEYLVEWTREHPIFILTLARPELAERRPTWGATRRNFTSLALEPLPAQDMDVLLTSPVPGLPDELRARILDRAEGIPFYAVETVRMLLDRGLIVREGNTFRPAGPIETLEVPETLQALISARLDGLDPDERRLLQDASVLGRTFTIRGLTTMTGRTEAELEPLLASLIRKEVLSLTADPMSAERGQYGFLQDLVKKVAYDTLSRRERKARHLAAASYLRSLGDEDEVVEVVAAHYVDAYRSAPDDSDAGAVKTEAFAMLVRAGERAASLGANAEAQSRFEEAAELTDDPQEQARLLERAGVTLRTDGRPQAAAELFQRARVLFDRSGARHAAARVSGRLGEAMWEQGRVEEAIELMDDAFQVVSQEEPDADLALLAAGIGRILFFSGQTGVAAERIEIALDISESLWLPEILSDALNTKSLTLLSKGRPQECQALLHYALQVALENDIPSAALRAYFNLAELALQFDRFEDGREHVRRGLALARRVGDRRWEWLHLGQLYPFFALGEWDEVIRRASELPGDELTAVGARTALASVLVTLPLVNVNRGELEAARRPFEFFEAAGISADVQERAMHDTGLAAVLHAQGRHAEALEALREPLVSREDLGAGSEAFREAFILAVEARLALEDLDGAEALIAEQIDALPVGKAPQYLRAHCARFRALIAAWRAQDDLVEPGFRRAAATFREIAVPFSLGVCLLEHGEWLVGEGRRTEAEPLLDEALGLFGRLGAKPWLDRTARAASTAREATTA